MTLWSTPYALLQEELRLRHDDGALVPAGLEARITALDPVADAWAEASVWGLYDELDAVPDPAGLVEREPDELEAIRARRPDGPRDLGWHPDDDELLDRLHGAWTGRAAGCALGKPVELIGCTDPDGRAVIKRYLSARGDWPLRSYVSGRDVGDGITLWCPASTREHIAYLEPDDDIHYSLAGLAIVEQHGLDFGWSDIARWWSRHLPLSALCTAEVQAFLTWANHTARLGPGARSVVTAARCRRWRNPYRDWIGAQIRSDGWAWVCAGRPELAAALAHRDAHWTHERTGIYGAMFFAAVQAAAFVVHDPRELIAIGLSEIPAASRFADVIRQTVTLCDRTSDWEAAVAGVEHLTDAMSPPRMNGVHTLNNAARCVVALLLAGMDTLEAPAVAVMSGADTDCNGATVGSIVGAAAGRSAFRPELADPLHDTIRPDVIGMGVVTMAELADRTRTQWHRIDDAVRSGRASLGA